MKKKRNENEIKLPHISCICSEKKERIGRNLRMHSNHNPSFLSPLVHHPNTSSCTSTPPT